MNYPRPKFHFTVESGWMNDPHGIIYHGGQYHLFFQYVPGSIDWKTNCHWGHAMGSDLLSMNELEPAISPGEGDDGIWTGSLVDNQGSIRVFYTSTSAPNFAIGRVRVAEPIDNELSHWKKGDFVADLPGGLSIDHFRDPFVFKDGEIWRMFLGAAASDSTALALGYSSPDLETWQYDGIVAQRNSSETEGAWSGAMWECPQIFPLGDRHAMVTSVWQEDKLHYAASCVGDYASGRFHQQEWSQLSYGSSNYAPSYFLDRDGRPALMFWLRGIGGESAGWSSAQSIPYLIELVNEKVVARPHPDIEKYHRPLVGRVSALDASWTPMGGSAMTFTDASGEVARIGLAGKQLTVVSQTGDNWTMPYNGGRVRAILDGPILEVCTDDGLGAIHLGAEIGGVAIACTAGELVAAELAR